MLTSSGRRRVAAAAAGINMSSIMSSQRRAAVAAGEREARIRVVEETIVRAAKAAKAIVAAVAALHIKEDDNVGDWTNVSWSPHRHRHILPSLERRRGHRGRCGSPVVHQVIKESKVGTPWLMLTKTNCNEWSLVMKAKCRPDSPMMLSSMTTGGRSRLFSLPFHRR